MSVKISQNEEILRAEHPQFICTFERTTGTFSLSFLDGEKTIPLFEHAGFAAHLVPGTEEEALIPYYSYADPKMFPLVITQKPNPQKKSAIIVLFSKNFFKHTLELQADIDPQLSYPLLSLRLVNNATDPIKIHSLCPIFIDPLSNPGSKFVGCEDWRNVSFFKNGFQSWSKNEILFWGDHDRSVPLHIGRKVMESENYDLIPEKGKQNAFYSDYFTVIYDRVLTLTTLIGFVTHVRHFTGIELIMGAEPLMPPRLVTVSHSDGVSIGKGEASTSETVLVCASKGKNAYLSLLKRYAASTGEKMMAITGESAGWPNNPTGWCSWYYYYQRVTEKDVLENLNYFASNKDEVPIQFIQIDDGYQNRTGDWTTLNAKFPSGMRAIVDQIHAAGFKAGLWVAPFLVVANSDTFISHPNWCILDAKGKFITVPTNPAWGRAKVYVLDPTNPEVQKHLEKVFQTITQKWGFDYVKIDFVYGACMKGSVYSDKTATRVDAYRLGLAAVRRGVGDEVFILGCGAPLGPSIGYCNAMRIGPDTNSKWEMLGLVNKIGRIWVPSLYPALHSTILHSFLHGQWWLNDPDCVMVRADKSKLTSEEVRTQLTIFGLSSGLILISDNQNKISAERIGWFQRLLPPSGIAALPADLMEKKTPEIFFKYINPAAFADGILVSITNFDKKAKTISLNLRQFGLEPSQTYHICEFWSEVYIGRKLGNEVLSLENIPPHDHRYLIIKPFTPEVPQIVATNLHINQGTLEIQDLTFNKEVKTLNFRVNLPGEHMGRLILYIPDVFAIDDTRSPGILVVDPPDENSICKVEIAFKDARNFVIQLV